MEKIQDLIKKSQEWTFSLERLHFLKFNDNPQFRHWMHGRHANRNKSAIDFYGVHLIKNK